MSGRRKLAVAALALWVALAALGPSLAPYSYRAQDRDCVLAPPGPCRAGEPPHWLGTDQYGRDELSRLLYACRVSLLLSLAMAGLTLGIAVPVALLSAASEAADGVGRWGGEVARSLPWVFLLVAVRAALPLDASRMAVLAVLVALFAGASWAVPAWVLRGAARELWRRDFVAAARALGAGQLYILRRHVWPNLLPLAATYFVLLLAAAATVEVSLSLVGLGVPPPLPSWGNMLLPLTDLAVAGHAWWLYAPLAVLVPVLAACNLYACTAAERPGF